VEFHLKKQPDDVLFNPKHVMFPEIILTCLNDVTLFWLFQGHNWMNSTGMCFFIISRAQVFYCFKDFLLFQGQNLMLFWLFQGYNWINFTGMLFCFKDTTRWILLQCFIVWKTFCCFKDKTECCFDCFKDTTGWILLGCGFLLFQGHKWMNSTAMFFIVSRTFCCFKDKTECFFNCFKDTTEWILLGCCFDCFRDTTGLILLQCVYCFKECLLFQGQNWMLFWLFQGHNWMNFTGILFWLFQGHEWMNSTARFFIV